MSHKIKGLGEKTIAVAIRSVDPPVFQTNTAFYAPSRFSNTPSVFSCSDRFGAADRLSPIRRFQKRWVSLHR